MAVTNYEKAQYLHYMINLLLPYLKQICQEQSQEEDIEAKIQGINLHLYLLIYLFCYCIEEVNSN
jgi:lysine-specific demethylase 3